MTAPERRITRNGSASIDGYRDFMSMFPTGVAVVTALDLYGMPHGLTCTALASVTLNPPTLLVCLHTGSGTLAAVRARGVFAVNLSHSGARGTAELFGSATTDRAGSAGCIAPAITRSSSVRSPVLSTPTTSRRCCTGCGGSPSGRQSSEAGPAPPGRLAAGVRAPSHITPRPR